jgi:hypothetical protein
MVEVAYVGAGDWDANVLASRVYCCTADALLRYEMYAPTGTGRGTAGCWSATVVLRVRPLTWKGCQTLQG